MNAADRAALRTALAARLDREQAEVNRLRWAFSHAKQDALRTATRISQLDQGEPTTCP